ncbi:MAG: lytic murein transglycosylase [Solirubrobacterales bacterium]|nr:lytic murein transglycosylase [Solirubrobacterales bacterium]
MAERARKIRAVAATAAATVALAIPVAAARAAAGGDNSAVPATALEEAASAPLAPGGPGPGIVKQGETLTPPATDTPSVPGSAGGVTAGEEEEKEKEAEEAEESEAGDEASLEKDSKGAVVAPSSPLQVIPSLPTSSCAASGVPPVLIPIYQRAAAKYGLGPQGPAVLAGINEVETGFGTNLNISSAGAEGWMQFMPQSWEEYGVDANGDGVKDPFNPEDAIYAAASYLSIAGMPADTYGAIFAYNHADWYVSEVLANAGCYAQEVGGPGFNAAGLGPQIQVLKCSPAPDWKDEVPAAYLEAFENAAARYELGKRGVWALAAVARLESNFGKGMDKVQMHDQGPLGLEPSEWKEFAVDGDEDGHIRHGDPADAAATLAREIWAKGSLGAGIFTHNQAEWYVQEVMQQAEQIEGNCKISYVDWRVAPLATGFETPGPTAVLTSDGLASAPRSAPPAVKAAIAAANSISTTPYVWGGGHGSWYSYGYDCSGAVSFALYGAGLLDTPLTSGSLESYGEPGPGKWITIYASATHTYVEIAGLRFDTVGDASGTGPRWHVEPPYPAGFVVRHPTGY